jgi:hypothetical protein
MQRYSNAIQALVYAGAAFLVVIVGLRGLGDLSGIDFFPKALLDEATGRISVNIVIVGLVAEFAMLMALAFLFYKAPLYVAESIGETKSSPASNSSVVDVAKLVDAERQLIESMGRKIETLIESERRIIEQIGNKYNEVADAQRQILDLLARRVNENHANNDETLKRIETNVDFLKSAHLVRRRTIPENTPTLS